MIAPALAESVLPTRKPRLLFRLSVVFLLRFAERRSSGLLFQEPPRTTRRQGAVQASGVLARSTGRPGRSRGATATYRYWRDQFARRSLDRSRRDADTWRLRHAIFRGGRFDPAITPEAWTAPCRRVVAAAVPGTTIHRTADPRTATGTPPDNRNNNLGFRVGTVRFAARAGAYHGRIGQCTERPGPSMMSTVGARVEMGARYRGGACLGSLEGRQAPAKIICPHVPEVCEGVQVGTFSVAHHSDGGR